MIPLHKYELYKALFNYTRDNYNNEGDIYNFLSKITYNDIKPYLSKDFTFVTEKQFVHFAGECIKQIARIYNYREEKRIINIFIENNDIFIYSDNIHDVVELLNFHVYPTIAQLLQNYYKRGEYIPSPSIILKEKEYTFYADNGMCQINIFNKTTKTRYYVNPKLIIQNLSEDIIDIELKEDTILLYQFSTEEEHTAKRYTASKENKTYFLLFPKELITKHFHFKYSSLITLFFQAFESIEKYAYMDPFSLESQFEKIFENVKRFYDTVNYDIGDTILKNSLAHFATYDYKLAKKIYKELYSEEPNVIITQNLLENNSISSISIALLLLYYYNNNNRYKNIIYKLFTYIIDNYRKDEENSFRYYLSCIGNFFKENYEYVKKFNRENKITNSFCFYKPDILHDIEYEVIKILYNLYIQNIKLFKDNVAKEIHTLLNRIFISYVCENWLYIDEFSIRFLVENINQISYVITNLHVSHKQNFQKYLKQVYDKVNNEYIKQMIITNVI